jgi:RecB family endonuclease NucS
LILKQIDSKLKPASRKNFSSEKELQTLFEANLESIFGCRFVSTEHHTGTAHGGRIDTLALSEDNNPVIIEYKNVENQGLVLQALFYLD